MDEARTDEVADEEAQYVARVNKSIQERKQNENHVRRLLSLGLAANTIYVVGAASFLAFGVLELNGRGRDTAANATYLTAFVGFFLSGLIEMSIDVFSVRDIRHGRYSSNRRTDLVISALFVTATILDLAAFFLWNERNFVPEHWVLFASAHIWIVTAILVLAIQIPEMIKNRSILHKDGLDAAGSVLFFVASLIDCIVRYLEDPNEKGGGTSCEGDGGGYMYYSTACDDSGDDGDAVNRLEFSSSPIWLVSAVCYVAADVLRLRKEA